MLLIVLKDLIFTLKPGVASGQGTRAKPWQCLWVLLRQYDTSKKNNKKNKNKQWP